jgi:hypothetical protein
MKNPTELSPFGLALNYTQSRFENEGVRFSKLIHMITKTQKNSNDIFSPSFFLFSFWQLNQLSSSPCKYRLLSDDIKVILLYHKSKRNHFSSLFCRNGFTPSRSYRDESQTEKNSTLS